MIPVISAMTPSDWERVAAIYAEGIATGEATFETQVPSFEAWDQSHLARPRLVASGDGQLAGWAALSPVSRRAVYAGVAETSIYVAGEARGLGIGGALLRELVEASEALGFWTLQAGIFTTNRASITLHERCGFRIVGIRERIAPLRGEWRDVALMERRSARIPSATAADPRA